EERRISDGGLQGGVATVGPAHDRQFVRVRDPLADEPVSCGTHVADGDLPGLEAVLLEPGLTVAARAPEVRLQHHKTARGEELRQPVKAPGVPSARTAM